MSFDKPTRNKLASMVSDCRRLLTDDIRHQLQAVYGLQPDGTALPVSSLSHLDERGREVASALRHWQEHLASTEAGTETQKRNVAFDRLAHETAFTVLNRLAALRMCEERGHVIECVRRGMESDGFVLYERFSEGVLGGRGETYRIFLERMFAELSVDLGALFDLDAPQSLVFPRQRCLEQVLLLLNRADLAHLWKEDETIGWIYQYFNSKEEREAMREASAAPRNSRELAVRNQFFTPRYVVEFLVDNTLGRIWYDMRQGQTALKETCHYLVRRPSEIFLSQGQQTPLSADAREDLSHDELVKHPVYIPYRAKRDPRTIKILDPAVGSGHFLLYAFDLLEAIYQEAWEETNQPTFEATGKTIREEYADLNTLRIALPELILRHNLHGIDIDLRACQIAALALWLRAQQAYQRLALKTADRPKITRSNIVCAEPMPGEHELLDQFLIELQPKVIGQLVQAVFEKMKLAAEAGSLLKIEEEIAEEVADAKQ
ncbi:MAG TPA: DNA methyltransferase, partial [Candidatus Acidoferrum sp.]|nr:DNA methyltransferase [Candidatus Acidoferrum sp.]